MSQSSIPTERSHGARLCFEQLFDRDGHPAIVDEVATASAFGADHLVMTGREWPTARAMKLGLVIEQL